MELSIQTNWLSRPCSAVHGKTRFQYAFTKGYLNRTRGMLARRSKETRRGRRERQIEKETETH